MPINSSNTKPNSSLIGSVVSSGSNISNTPNPPSNTKLPPKNICGSCKTVNDLNAITCKKCGEILKKNTKLSKQPQQEYDPTEGSFSPSCIVIPAIMIILAVVFFILAVSGGAKKGTCEYNRAILSRAVSRYNKAHPNNPMTTLNQDELMRPRSGKKPFIKEKVICPNNPSAEYVLDPDGVTVSCTHCSQKKR